MTIKQGQEINQKFSSLNDSILLLNKNLEDKKTELVIVDKQKKSSDSNLLFSMDKIMISNQEIERLNKTIVDRDNKFWGEKKIWAGWMFFSVAVTVLVAALK